MSDSRFARLKTDPRFRKPRTKQTKVVVDERFKSVFEMSEKDKQKGKKVDKYGRKVSSNQDQENLRKYYRLENEDEEPQGEPDDEQAGPPRPDYARGEGLVESSSEDEDESDIDDGPVILGADQGSSKFYNPSDDERSLEIDLNEDDAEIDPKELKRRYAALDAQAFADDDEEEEEEVDDAERTCRLAVVNLDWDHIRAHHLYKICASLVSSTAPIIKASASKIKPPVVEKGAKGKGKMALDSQVTIARGKVLSVRIYPSEFGKERMAREEKEGPPPEVFKRYKRERAIEKGLLDVEDITVNDIYEVAADGEDDYDEDALRNYQLERLRYYYAIIECDTADAATHIYNELQGTELERSANVFDMSFVPDGMVFDSEPRDEATDELNTEYKAVEFVTDALRHSKVKLTWDDDDPERNKVTRRAMTEKEIDGQDFRNYIANSSDSSSEEEDEADRRKKSKKGGKKDKKAERERLRALLLGGGEDMPEGWGEGDAFGNDDDGDIDMEVTFSSALSGKKANEDETTLEKYQRKMREKRKRRKDDVKEKNVVQEEDTAKDEFFEGSSGGEEERPKKDKGDKQRKAKEDDEEPESTRQAATAEELALLVATDNPDAEPKHFSLKSVIKAEKGKKRRGRKDKKKGEDNNDEAQEDFVMDVKDERFKALHENHEFAIDPTNPHFKKTKSMAALLDERQKRQQSLRGERPESRPARSEQNAPSGGNKSLQSLVESVKRKSQASETQGQGKRRKL